MKDISNVDHLDALSDALKRADADRADICITGSSVLALWGVKENPDVDFVAAEPSRSKLVEYIRQDPDSRHIPGVRGEIGEHLELSIKDRLSEPPYLFGLSDEEVVHDDRYHVEVDGWKFLRPELVLSMKGAKRRGKDVRDIHRMQDSSILDSEWWDWNLVLVVPPWKRTFATEEARSSILAGDTIFHEFVKSTKDVGLLETLRRGGRLLRSGLERRTGSGSTIGGRLAGAASRTLATDLELRYPLPNLIARQYDPEGRFVWAGGEDPEGEDPPEPRRGRRHEPEISVTREGRMVAGHRTVERRLDDWREDLPAGAPEKSFRVRVAPGSRLGGLLGGEELPEPGRVLTGEEKLELLRSSGACFFAILWPSLQDHFDRAQDLVGSEFEVLDVDDLELDGDWSIGRFIEAVYSQDDRTEEWFMRNRISVLSGYEPKLRILTLEVPDPTFTEITGSPVVEDVYDRKMEFRREIGGWLEDYTYGTCIHMTDNFRHNAHVADLLSRVKEGKGPPAADEG